MCQYGVSQSQAIVLSAVSQPLERLTALGSRLRQSRGGFGASFRAPLACVNFDKATAAFLTLDPAAVDLCGFGR